MAYDIEKIEGIGKIYGEKLRAAGIKDTGALLTACAGPKDRAAVAARTGIPAALVLEFANRADLMRAAGRHAPVDRRIQPAGRG